MIFKSELKKHLVGWSQLDITILVVDDEPDYLELMQGILEQEGYDKILTETNPLNVDSILKEQKIDLIILDIYMPQIMT